MDAETAYVRLALNEQHLLRERAALNDELDEFEAEPIGALEGLPGDVADAASATFEREKDSGLIEDLDAGLDEIAHARRRIELGTYGQCESCGQPIGADRLEAMPATRFCLTDALEHDRPLGGINL